LQTTLTGGIWRKRHFWEKKDVITPARLMEIWTDPETHEVAVENPVITMQADAEDKVFCYTEMASVVPPSCVMEKKQPFGFLFDPQDNILYMVPDNYGSMTINIGDNSYTVRVRDFKTIDRRTIVGFVKLVNLMP
jgi:hypothetical protein